MKIQSLAVIFIIIILPISMILTAYTKSQMQTLNLQITYDSRLKNATYDAIKAFQLNTVNSSTSDLANSKLRDIEASVNTFFNSVSKNFNMEGYNSDILKEYVPALVYTMYDGYYIYSPFTNKLDDTKDKQNPYDENSDSLVSDKDILGDIENNPYVTYTDGQRVSELKPYIYYSCRYSRGDLNVVINYSLDNYIAVRGKKGNQSINISGYVINPDNINNVSDNSVSYRGTTINSEQLMEEYIGPIDNANTNLYQYIKINGVKYYKYKDIDNTEGWFSLLNGERYRQDDMNIQANSSAVKYYTEAKDFMTKLQNFGILELKASDVTNSNGEKISDFKNDDYYIFSSDKKSAEEPDSNFNQHRLAVIRYSIERNLSIAIANYNNYSGITADFQMPNLAEDEWDKILNNVSLISFLQGLNIGGKIYNGYSIITNNKNEEVVSEDSIYIVGSDTYYHRINDIGFENASIIPITGVFNIDFEVKSIITGEEIKYFYPRIELASYSSIVNQIEVNQMDNIYMYIDNSENSILKKVYYTALARERYSMYRTENNAIEIKNKLQS